MEMSDFKNKAAREHPSPGDDFVDLSEEAESAKRDVSADNTGFGRMLVAGAGRAVAWFGPKERDPPDDKKKVVRTQPVPTSQKVKDRNSDRREKKIQTHDLSARASTMENEIYHLRAEVDTKNEVIKEKQRTIDLLADQRGDACAELSTALKEREAELETVKRLLQSEKDNVHDAKFVAAKKQKQLDELKQKCAQLSDDLKSSQSFSEPFDEVEFDALKKPVLKTLDSRDIHSPVKALGNQSATGKKNGEELDSHSGQKDSVRSSPVQLLKELAEKSRQVENLENQLKEAQGSILQAAQVKGHSKAQSRVLMTFKQELDATEMSHDELVGYIQSLKQQIADTEEFCQRLQTAKDQLSSDKEYMEQALKDTRRTFEEAINEQKVLLSKLVDTRSSLEVKLCEAKEKIDDITQERDVLKKEAVDLQDRLQIARTETDLYKEDFLQERKDRENAHALKEEMRLVCDEKVHAMQVKLDNTRLAHKEDIMQLTRKLENMQSKQLELSQELERMTSHLDQMNVENQSQEIRRLQTVNQNLEERVRRSDELGPYCLPQLPHLGECRRSGAYGSVYHIQLNGVRCIAKRVHDILLGQGREERVSLEDTKAAYEKFRQECILLSRMRHPNIVQFMGIHYGLQRDYGRELTLVMECLYMDLEECLKTYAQIDMWLKLSMLLDICQGLLHLHSQGIVHRDLTAANILLTTSFQAKIADLGVSKIINVHPLAGTKASKVPGSLGYMPPEALAEVPQYGYSLDIFSFGVLMLFVLIQEYPQFYENAITHTGLQRKETQIQKRRKWIDRLPQGDSMKQLVCHCLQDEPQRRPTAGNLKSALLFNAQSHPKPFSDILELQKQVQISAPGVLSGQPQGYLAQNQHPPRPVPRQRSEGSYLYH